MNESRDGSAEHWRDAAAVFRALPTRITQREFWLIQATVLAISALHAALEAAGFWEQRSDALETLPHIPMIMLLAPITIAGFRYGLEGGLLTGLWSAILAVPNLLLWHTEAYAWVGEVSYLFVITVVGVLVSVPVEREKQERRRAEAASLRLALLNDATSTLAGSTDVPKALRYIGTRLVEVLGVDDVSISLDGESPPSTERDADEWCAAIESEGERLGSLTVTLAAGRTLAPEDRGLLRAVAGQIAVAVNTERLHQQESDHLRSYVRHVTRAQEEERKRISRELHDGAAQSLVLLCRQLDTAAGNGSAASSIADLRPLAQETLASLRRFSRDLRPPVLDDLGLEPALGALATTVSRRSGIAVSVDSLGERRRLSSEVELTLYRIAQEALRNVEKHASARAVTLSLRHAPSSVQMAIADDGVGFTLEPSHLRTASGRLGLIGMQERAQLIGATLSIDATPGRGTTVAVTYPAAGEHPGG